MSAMDSHEEDIAWLNSTFRPIPKPTLPDDCIEYTLYLIDAKLDSKNSSEERNALREIQKHATKVQKQWLKEYIWQRQTFNLELVSENGLNSLRGQTEYGDSIEDEWVVVWLLRELSKQFPKAWVKVTDTDGEFLLIEASGTLPAWLEPEVAENRVWINDGQLKIIKPASTKSKEIKRTDEKLTLGDAQNIISNDKRRLMHSTSMEEEAFYRLRNYPTQIDENMHHAVLTVPRKVAYLLLQNPAYVAPAVEAFYLRDPISLKGVQNGSSKLFLPSDVVELSIRFPRVAYAQLKSQEFPVLDSWKQILMTEGDSGKRMNIETGMKLACGFEMLMTDSHHQDRAAVREMHLLLEDLQSDEAHLPTDEEIAHLDKRADDEKWMDISFDDLQTELNTGGKTKEMKGKKPEFGDKAAQENLQRIVKQFEAFLNDDDADEGMGAFGDEEDDGDLDDIDSDDLDEDKDASFAEADFTKLMQEMMGLPPEVMDEMMKGDISAFKDDEKPQGEDEMDMSSDEDAEDAEIQELARRMGAELHASGALEDTTAGSSKSIKTSHQVHFDDSDEEMFDREMTKNMIESFRAQAGQQGPASNLLGMMAEREVLPTKKQSRKGKEPVQSSADRSTTPQPTADMVEDLD